MPSKAGYSWPSGFPLPCSQTTSAEDLTEVQARVSSDFLCVCVGVTALGSRKEPCPGPPKHKGPSTPNALQNRPLSSAECCAVFGANRHAFLCPGQCSVGLSCTPTCSAISPRVTGHAMQMKATPTGISLTHQLAL
jgi:hypothetical protein